MRTFLGFLGIAFLIASAIFGLELITGEGRAQITVFQQLVLRVTFGLSFLCALVALGISALLGEQAEQRKALDEALKGISENAAETAANIRAIREFVDAMASRAAARPPAPDKEK